MNPLRFPRAFVGLIPATIALLASCSIGPDAGPMEPASGGGLVAALGKPQQDSVILAMTVTDGSPYQVQSDGLGEYRNGVAGMEVVIDGYGNLQISPNNANSSTPPVRRLHVSYPTNLTDTYLNQWNFKIKTSGPSGHIRIQDLAVGQSVCLYVTISHMTQAIAYQDLFDRNLGASYGLVTRTSPTTWTAVSKGVDSSGLNCGADDLTYVQGSDLTVKRGGGFTVGLLTQPFSIALRVYP
jgi:hypothetical protein